MATITVTITNVSILAKVTMIASFVGSARDDEGKSLYENVRVTTQDTPMLEKFLGEAKENILATYSDISSVSSGNIVFSVPEEHLSNLVTSVQEQVVDFIVNYICRCWFELRAADKAEEYQRKGALNIQMLNDLLYSRKAPTVPNGATLGGFITLTAPSGH